MRETHGLYVKMIRLARGVLIGERGVEEIQYVKVLQYTPGHILISWYYFPYWNSEA